MTDDITTAPAAPTALCDLDDEALVAACAQDPRAFGEIVRRHQQLVFGSAFRVVKDPTLAEDIAQDAFLRAFKALDSFRGESDLAGWLYRIARNLAINAVTRRRETPSETLPEMADLAGTPESEVMRQADVTAVRTALEEIPELLRRPLVMREYGHMTYEEIAEEIGIPLNTVRTRIFRAKRALELRLMGEAS